MEKILTIVVPSYNVEKFLNNTLDSFVCDDATMEKLEVIVVDDGSKDSTAMIGKSYSDKYPGTFKVISKENGGHGSTINCGIKNATGKYFKVVDGDDWVNTSDFVKFIALLEDCESDYIFTNYSEYYDDINEEKKITYSDFADGREFTSFSELPEGFIISMHALTIKTSILKNNNIQISEKCFYVDVEYIMYPVPFVNKITFFDLYIYMYRLNLDTQSVSVVGFQKHINDHIRVTFNMIDFLNKYSSSAECDLSKVAYIKNRAMLMILTQSSIYSSYPHSDKEKIKEFKQFDAEVKNKNAELYELSSQNSKKLALLRKFDFKLYRLIQFLSAMSNR